MLHNVCSRKQGTACKFTFYIYQMINSEKAFFLIRIIITAYCFRTDTCAPGTTWQQDCNTCSCTETGRSVCTAKACLPRLKRQTSCKLYIKKRSDKLNSNLPRDYSHLEHDAVWFSRYITSLHSNIIPPTLG